MKLHILTFKNYSNRQATRYSTLAEYAPYQIYEVDNIDFNRADGVATSQVINTDTAELGDYLIVSDNGEIVSRWYIVENTWNRMGQVLLSLKRDLIADFRDEVLNTDCIIERAMLDVNDPLIFNSEPFSVNQIKSGESLLKDETGCPWLVAYVAKGEDIEYNPDSFTNEVVDVGNVTRLPLYDWIKPDSSQEYTTLMEPATRQLNVYVNAAGDYGRYDGATYKYTYKVSENSIVSGTPNFFNSKWQIYSSGVALLDAAGAGATGPIDYQPPSRFTQPSSGTVSSTQLGIRRLPAKQCYNNMNAVEIENGAYDIPYDMRGYLAPYLDKIYKYKTLVYNDSQTELTEQYAFVQYHLEKKYDYTVNIGLGNTKGYSSSEANLFDNIREAISVSASGVFDDQYYAATANLSAGILGKAARYELSCVVKYYKPVQYASHAYERDSHAIGNYDIICSPFATKNIYTSGGTVANNKESSLWLYQNMANQNPGKIYDIQILPYCPARLGYVENSQLASSYKTVGLPDSTNVVLINVQKDNCSFSIANRYFPEQNNAARKKRNVITETYRLCDPGYNGVFEFSVEANGGVTHFNVDMTAKPFNPFVHIAPNFGNLYGADYNDARGLTLGSNFSITTTSDKWAEFELQNKNYQEMFNRQIQNMETKFDIQRQEAKWQAFAGTLQGTVSGASGGALAGSAAGPYGAAIGGAVGGLAGYGGSLAAGLADIENLNKLQNEELDYARDMHIYQLDNIKALPDSLTRVSMFNNIFKWFPFIEYYTCTDKEKEVIDNYIKWQSMNVNAIGKIQNYLKSEPTYIRAVPLRLNINEDAHMAVEIAAEIQKGIYI